MEPLLLLQRPEPPPPPPEAEREQDTEEGLDPVLRCAACEHPVTRPRHRVARQGAHQHTFVNPAGVVFEVACFAEAEGALALGAPTRHFTWFAAYAWRYAHCGGCGAHLGWRFEGPEPFWGLIRPRLA